MEYEKLKSIDNYIKNYKLKENYPLVISGCKNSLVTCMNKAFQHIYKMNIQGGSKHTVEYVEKLRKNIFAIAHYTSIFILEFVSQKETNKEKKSEGRYKYKIEIAEHLKNGHSERVFKIKRVGENRFISGSFDMSLKVWDKGRGGFECVNTIPINGGMNIHLHSTARILVTTDKFVKFYNPSTYLGNILAICCPSTFTYITSLGKDSRNKQQILDTFSQAPNYSTSYSPNPPILLHDTITHHLQHNISLIL